MQIVGFKLKFDRLLVENGKKKKKNLICFEGEVRVPLGFL